MDISALEFQPDAAQRPLWLRIALRAARRLKPDEAWGNPAQIIAEAIAALLTLLAVRDGLTDAGPMAGEALGAIALWGVLLSASFVWAARAEMNLSNAPS